MMPGIGMARSTIRRWLGSIAYVAVSSVVLRLPSTIVQTEAAQNARLVASPEPGWPQWRGPRRDGISDETGLAPTWPQGGPRMIWSANDLGRGYSAPVIQGNRIWLTGDVNEELRIFALDLEGKQVWQATNGAAWKGPYPGARSCVAVSGGRLFHLNAHGRVVCLDPASGRELWAAQLFDLFGGKNNTWGMSECLLVDNEHVIVTPGGSRALMAALNAGDGSIVWATQSLRLGASDLPRFERVLEPEGEWDHASYASPILINIGGRRMLLNTSLRHMFGVDATTGELLWTRALPSRFEVIASSVVLVDDGLFVTAPDAGGGRLYRLRQQNHSVIPELVWTSPLDTCHGGVVLVNGRLYGSWYRAGKGWAAIEAESGAVRYELAGTPKGSILYGDHRIYALSETGEMLLLRPGAAAFAVEGRFQFVGQKVNDAWAHPVVESKRLYLRYHERLACYDVDVGKTDSH